MSGKRATIATSVGATLVVISLGFLPRALLGLADLHQAGFGTDRAAMVVALIIGAVAFVGGDALFIAGIVGRRRAARADAHRPQSLPGKANDRFDEDPKPVPQAGTPLSWAGMITGSH